MESLNRSRTLSDCSALHICKRRSHFIPSARSQCKKLLVFPRRNMKHRAPLRPLNAVDQSRTDGWFAEKPLVFLPGLSTPVWMTSSRVNPLGVCLLLSRSYIAGVRTLAIWLLCLLRSGYSCSGVNFIFSWLCVLPKGMADPWAEDGGKTRWKAAKQTDCWVRTVSQICSSFRHDGCYNLAQITENKCG